MQTGKRIRLACLLTLALLLPVQAYALGVGKLTVNSALDEPLDASIELTSATVTELSTLQARLAVRGVFQQAGIEYTDSISQITFTIDKNPAGKSYIRLQTEQPFRDPFMHFVLEVTWGGGQMYREYTALLDPPSFTSGLKQPVSMPVVDRRPAPEPAAVSPATPEAPPPIAAPETAAATSLPEPTESAERKLGPSTSGAEEIAPPAAGEQSYQVKRGDALWGIAEQFQAGSDHSVPQEMMAIFHANPDAFLHNNINYLKEGRTLRIPPDDEVVQRSHAEARSEMRAQMQQWKDYRSGQLTSVASTVEAPDEMPQETADQAEDVDRQDAAAEAQPNEQEEVLKIVQARYDEKGQAVTEQESVATTGSQPEAPGAETGDQENVALLQESLAAAELEKKELAERVSMLEAQIDKANKLIDMQNEDLARLQSNLDQEGVPAQTTEPAEEQTAEEAEAGTPAVEDAEVSAPVAEAAEVAEPAPVQQPTAEEKPAAKVTKIKPRVAPKPEPISEPGFFASLMDSFTDSATGMIGGIVLIVLVLVGLFVVLRRRRSISEFEDSIISGTAVLDISTAESAEPSESQSETSFLSDFVPGMANVQADEVDPLAEAEVYMAYGRDEQAEDVLKKAVAKTPDRHELKLKLLEIYASRKDVTSFETIAEELYPVEGSVPDDVWKKVAELGREVNPENPLFQEGGAPADTQFGKQRESEKQLSDLLGTEDVEHTEEIVDHEEADHIEELDIEDNSDKPSAAEDLSVPEPEEDVLDMDLGEFEPDEAQETGSFKIDDAEEEPLGGGIDFDMEGIDLDLGVEEKPGQDETLEFADLEDLSLPAEEAAEGTAEEKDEEWDECTTKLDLARAYMEMGDNDGAESLLNEVAVEGNDDQKQQAQELLTQINA